MSFVHMHVHGHHSVLDGCNSPAEIVQRAAELGHPAVALTDHGTLAGHRELQKAAKEHGIKPILGLEAYISATDRFDRRADSKRADGTSVYNHVILLAKSQQGLQNLQRLSEIAWSEGFYYKPRIDFDLLDEYGDDLVVLSGCMSGLIAKAIENEDHDKAVEWTNKFAERFGEDFYIEVQPHNPVSLNTALVELARSSGIKLIPTSDAHYAWPHDKDLEEVLLVLSTNPKRDKEKTYSNTEGMSVLDRLDALYPGRTMTFAELNLYMQSREELEAGFEATVPGLLTAADYDNTLRVAEKVGEYEYYEGLDLLPLPDKLEVSAAEKLRERAYKGLRGRGLADKQQYVDRLEEELAVITQKNFDRYFLVVHDLVRWAKQRGILVGDGRGSAAGSLLCYVLRITDIDPIEERLLFFRFINPERNDYPDIDLDFEDRRRHEVKEYLRKKYGNAASISTFGFFKDKGVIRDVARVFAVPLAEVNAVLKTFDTFEQFMDAESTREFREKYPLVAEYAQRMRGKIRSVGMHAAGIVVSKEPIERYVPVEYREDPSEYVTGRVPVVAVDMEAAADIGLIKLDILGLKTLSVVADTLELIEQRHGAKLDLASIDYDDPVVLRRFAEGRTVGVFQAEAAPYTRLLKTMGCDSFEDLAASNALVRPGAMNTVGGSFVRRKFGQEAVEYPHQLVEPFLRDTYGVVIYQEQVMQICTELAGMSMSDADKLRKIIGKKLSPEEFKPYYDSFIDGATKHVSRAVADELWHTFEAHAGYSFNRSHAVAYSRLSYKTMWLKENYPLEFMCALLRNESEKEKLTEYFIEAKRLGLTIRLPHVNKSGLTFSIENDDIRIGLSNIKYISKKIAPKLLDRRPFKTYAELLEFSEQKGSGVSTRVVGALNKIGAASFPDNPKTGEEVSNYYEYLSLPAFKHADVPDWLDLDTLDEVDENGAFIVKAMVTKVKHGDGWSLVELVDETGRGGAFHDKNTPLVAGQQYFLLIAMNRVMEWLTVEEFVEQLAEPKHQIAKYLLKPLPFTVCLSAQTRRTKSRALMASVVFARPGEGLIPAMVWPSQFGSVYGKLKPGHRSEPVFGVSSNGTRFVQRV